MELIDGDYILGLLYGEFPNQMGNVLYTFLKRGGKWIGEWRNRYYQDGKEDKKTFYNLNFREPCSEKDIQENIFKIMNEITFYPGSKAPILYDYIEIKGNREKLIEILKDKPWAKLTEEII